MPNGFYCDKCKREVPDKFQREHISDAGEEYHLHKGIRMIKLGSAEWRDRVVPALKEQLKKLQASCPKLILFTIFLLAPLAAFGQCVDRPNDPCVPVHQSVIDGATAAATELLAARQVIEAFGRERTATQQERESAARLIDRLNSVILVQDRLNLEYNAVIALYKAVVQMQSELIEKLSKQLNAPKSAWQKFVSALKTIANVALGIVIGRAGI